MEKWISELKKGFNGDIAFDNATLEENSKDASIFIVKPKVVVYPKDAADVEHLVNFVKKRKGLSLTARAAGTDMSGGSLTESIVVSFTKYMNKLKKLDLNHAIVEPGLYYRDFEKEMEKKGVMYGSYPASKSICAMGGIIANNSGGEKSLTYGQTVDHVNSVKMVLSDGKLHEFKKLNKEQLQKKMSQSDFEGRLYKEMYNLCEDNYELIKNAEPKVSKNSSGYLLWRVFDKEREEFDLSKIFVGSQGTLGLWMEADINVVKKNKHSRLVVASLRSLEQITPLVEIVKKYKPESLESFDRRTLELALEFIPEIAKKINKNIISFLWGFRRDVESALMHGIPIFIVLIELTGDKEKEIQKRATALGKELAENKIVNLPMQSEEEADKYWIMRRESFNLLRQKVKNKMATPFVDDFSVKPEYLSEFLPKLYKLLEDNGVRPTLAGHVGDGNFHIIPLMDLSNEEERKKIPIIMEKFTDLVNEYHGSMTAEHNDGLIRTTYLGKQFGAEVVQLFNRVKEIFDPQGIFNPGKKVHGDIKFAMSHIKKK